MSTVPTATRMQVLFWLPDGGVIEYRPTEVSEVTETMEFLGSSTGEVSPLWRARDVTVHQVHPVRHSPGYLTPDQRRIKELEADVARLIAAQQEQPE